MNERLMRIFVLAMVGTGAAYAMHCGYETAAGWLVFAAVMIALGAA